MTQTDTATNPKIDPRLRARRIAVRRDLGRRRLNRILALLGTTGLVALAWAVTQSPLLDVDRVAVSGALHSDAGEIVAASGVERGDALLYVDLAKVRHRVGSLPWVQSVDVERRWFGTLGIVVTERTPVAALPGRGGGWVVASAEGRLLDTAARPPGGLPVIEGGGFGGRPGETVAPVALGALRVAGALPPSLRERVGSVAVTREGTVRLALALDDGHPVEVRLGPPEDVAAKLLALAALLDEADLSRARVVDLRVPDVPTVTNG